MAGGTVAGATAVAVEPAVRVTAESLRRYGEEAFRRVGLPEDGAAIVTDVQLEASLRGQPTHNMGNVPGYASRVAKGVLNPTPAIRIERESGVHAQIDGDNGPGQWVGVVAMRQAIAKAKAGGVGMVTARHSNHYGAAGHYAWLAAREGLIGISTTNGGPCLAPWGGVTPTLGNNPLGVGIPAGAYPPLLLDIAMSMAAMGKIALAIAEGRPLPPDWVLDKRGHPTTNPQDFRESFLGAPIGAPGAGYKGTGLTMVMETLAGVLSGASAPWEHRDDRRERRDYAPDLGHFFMAIDPGLFMPLEAFTARVDAMIAATKGGERMEGVEEILVPGEAELRARERNLAEGVPLLPSTYRTLQEYRQQAGLEAELVPVP
jgi:LDH2 family malate/lactate/ureidoglycolate dehydrogenase